MLKNNDIMVVFRIYLSCFNPLSFISFFLLPGGDDSDDPCVCRGREAHRKKPPNVHCHVPVQGFV